MGTCVLTCAEAKKIDLVDYLASLGHHPKKVSHPDYWFLSPFRDEKTASFKVNRKLNVFYDHGIGKGGDLINFGTQYFNCSVSEFLNRLSSGLDAKTLSFHPPLVSQFPAKNRAESAGEKKQSGDGKIIILNDRRLCSDSLLNYLEKRKIPVEIADHYCREIDFLLNGKKHTVVGFKNSAGVYELRSENYKGSSSPKGITFIDNRTQDVAVFEGFFSFLSFCTINKNPTIPLTNFLVLNSLSFFQKGRDKMEDHQQVHLYLDRDEAGIKHTLEAREWNKERYIDQSDFYDNYKDLNVWLMDKDYHRRQNLRPGRLL